MIHRKIQILIALFIISVGGAAQQYDFKNYSVEEGLPQSIVMSSTLDGRGFMWFATSGGGVACFDGNKFSTLSEEDGLVSNKVLCVYQDKKGDLWFGTDKGVSVYNGYGINSFENEKKLKNVGIYDILESSNGDVWLASNTGGLVKYHDEKFTYYTEDDGLLSNVIYSLYEHKERELYIGTLNGLNVFDGKNFTKVKGVSSAVVGVSSYKGDSVLVSTYDGEFSIITSKLAYPFDNLNKHKVNKVNKHYIDSKQNIWIGTFGNGLYRFENDSIINWNSKNSTLTNDFILSIWEDNSNDIWLGSHLGGVYKLKKSAFLNFDINSGLDNLVIGAITESKDHNIWFGSRSGGISYYDGEQIHMREKLNSRILDIYFDSKGRQWVATNGEGVLMREEGINSKLNTIKNFPSKNVECIQEDGEGNIWFGTTDLGLVAYDGSDYNVITTDESNFKSKVISCFLKDSKEELWIGSLDGGLIRYKDGIFTQHLDSNAVLLNHIVDIKEDIFHNLWIATKGGGIVHYYEGKYTVYNKKDGLSSNNINFIDFDNANNLWVSTDKGLDKVVFELVDYENYIEYIVNNVSHYSKEDGLASTECVNRSGLIDSKGKIWIGTLRGVSAYFKSDDRFNLVPPKVYINNVKLSHDDVDWKSRSDSVSRWFGLPNNLELEYNENNITFDYLAINLVVPDKIKYKIMLEGADEDWSPEITSTTQSYTNLPPGDYTFKVLAANEDLIWSQKPATFSFTIKSPFWKKWWFYTIVIILILGIFWTYTALRTRNIKIQNIKLEGLVKKRTTELQKEKEVVDKVNGELAKKNTQILDSIRYAKRIQMAILPPESKRKASLPNSFIMYKPKDIVSGDFYWLKEANGKVYFAAVDCTGHGVPGAFMSIVGYRILELIIAESKLTDPAEILNELHNQVLETLHLQEDSREDIRDGMDIALCVWDKKKNVLEYSGAHNALYHVRDNNLVEYPANARPIGMSLMRKFKPFTSASVKIKPGDLVYIFTDGFADQFGGEKFKKYYYQNFQKLLLDNISKSMEDQRICLEDEFDAWKGENDQFDDVLIMGVKF